VLSPQALARGVTRLLESPELAHRIAEAGCELAERFTWQARATRLVDVFHKAVQSYAAKQRT
jgi:glycosyltransferase involved in cell wall biosynthesis